MADTKTEKKEPKKSAEKSPYAKKPEKVEPESTAPMTMADRLLWVAEMHPGLIGNRLYGPFTDYQIVTTDFGDFGLARHLLLGFELEDRLDKESFQMVKVPRSRYYRLSDGKRVRGNGFLPEEAPEGEDGFGEEHGHGNTVPPPDWSG